VPFPVQPDVEDCLFLPQNRGTTAASVSKVVPTHRHGCRPARASSSAQTRLGTASSVSLHLLAPETLCSRPLVQVLDVMTSAPEL